MQYDPTQTVREAFEAEVERFLKESGMSATAFGVEVKDRAFVHQLREGRDVKVSKADAVLRYIREARAATPDRREG